MCKMTWRAVLTREALVMDFMSRFYHSWSSFKSDSKVLEYGEWWTSTVWRWVQGQRSEVQPRAEQVNCTYGLGGTINSKRSFLGQVDMHPYRKSDQRYILESAFACKARPPYYHFNLARSICHRQRFGQQKWTEQPHCQPFPLQVHLQSYSVRVPVIVPVRLE